MFTTPMSRIFIFLKLINELMNELIKIICYLADFNFLVQSTLNLSYSMFM